MLQLTYNRFNPIPDFLKVGIYFWSLPVGSPTYISFVEGWGLYAEYLGHELKMYDEDPYQATNVDLINVFGLYNPA